MKLEVDLAIVGSGFAGSLLALIGRRLGLSVALLERGRHPRFVIGESSTPLANLLLEEIAREYELPRVAALSKWGTWQKCHPTVGCGLKRGFTFFHHHAGRPWKQDPERRSELLVAASPRDEIADTHWYRPDFDHWLVGEAQSMGAHYLDEVQLSGVRCQAGRGELTGLCRGSEVSVRAGLVVDASGPRGFLHRTLRLPEQSLPGFPPTQGLYTHFGNVRRWDSLHPQVERPPYPVDDAAVHHVFAGGWIWVLRFNNGLVSAGVAAVKAMADELQLSEGPAAWNRLLHRFPSIQEQFAEATTAFPFVHADRLSFRSRVVAEGPWVLLPSAAGFVDPLLSTGFPLTLLGVQRLGRLLAAGKVARSFRRGLEDYAAQTLAELDLAAELVAALYASFDDFELFTALTFLYFAAVMYSESARRRGQPEMAPGFLLLNHSGFAPNLRRCLERAPQLRNAEERRELLRDIAAAIEPFNLAGLANPARRNWYPVAGGQIANSK